MSPTHAHRWGESQPVLDGPSSWFRTCSEPGCDAWIASSAPGPPTYPDVSGAVDDMRRAGVRCSCPPPDGDDPDCQFHGAWSEGRPDLTVQDES